MVAVSLKKKKQQNKKKTTSRRPLDKRQIDYAIGDVTHLAKIFPMMLKKLIKTGYALSGALTAGGASAMDSAKDLMAESKAEFDAGQAAKAEVA